jgi:hypothetical protein
MNAYEAEDGAIAIVPNVSPVITVGELNPILDGDPVVVPEELARQLNTIVENGHQVIYVQKTADSGAHYYITTMTYTHIETDEMVVDTFSGLESSGVGLHIFTFLLVGGVWMATVVTATSV